MTERRGLRPKSAEIRDLGLALSHGGAWARSTQVGGAIEGKASLWGESHGPRDNRLGLS